ncbi:hypothetical protein F5Y05DRAFT_308611 [Hypoxylon sp. FL0543]|nr:hypothetical protein F5Y05DRAFT_308611 [Hypoxylon sp. FL0543]
MFEHFAFTLKADSDTPSDDDEPPPSPKSNPSDHTLTTRTAMATPTTVAYNSESDRIESLVRKMSKQTLVRESQPAFTFESQDRDTTFNLPTTQVPIQIQIQAPSDIPGPSMEIDTNQYAQPVIDNHATQARTQRQYEIIGNRQGSIDEGSSLRVHDGDRSSRQLETRRNSNSPNSRAVDLMTSMIENGVQCNLHVSGPTSPMIAAQQPSPAANPTPPNRPDFSLNPQIFADNNMELEVDADFLNQNDDEEVFPSDPMALRNAGVPAGIRKFGYLKYRSSYEAAARCKNMRKSIPRMRRRPKASRPPSTTSSSMTSSTTI